MSPAGPLAARWRQRATRRGVARAGRRHGRRRQDRRRFADTREVTAAGPGSAAPALTAAAAIGPGTVEPGAGMSGATGSPSGGHSCSAGGRVERIGPWIASASSTRKWIRSVSTCLIISSSASSRITRGVRKINSSVRIVVFES